MKSTLKGFNNCSEIIREVRVHTSFYFIMCQCDMILLWGYCDDYANMHTMLSKTIFIHLSPLLVSLPPVKNLLLGKAHSTDRDFFFRCMSIALREASTSHTLCFSIWRSLQTHSKLSFETGDSCCGWAYMTELSNIHLRKSSCCWGKCFKRVYLYGLFKHQDFLKMDCKINIMF